MQRLSLDQPIPEPFRGAVVALGNFDGFHLGHQAVVGRAVQRGAHERRPVIVATFDPHPVRFFRPDAPPFRLTTLNQRERLFAHAGADAMLVARHARLIPQLRPWAAWFGAMSCAALRLVMHPSERESAVSPLACSGDI